MLDYSIEETSNFQKDEGGKLQSGAACVLEFSNEGGHFFQKSETIYPPVYHLWYNLILPFLHLVADISAF